VSLVSGNAGSDVLVVNGVSQTLATPYYAMATGSPTSGSQGSSGASKGSSSSSQSPDNGGGSGSGGVFGNLQSNYGVSDRLSIPLTSRCIAFALFLISSLLF